MDKKALTGMVSAFSFKMKGAPSNLLVFLTPAL